MKQRSHCGIAACLLALPFSLALAAPLASHAQGGPPPGGGPGGGPPPQFQAWQEWRMTHPNVDAVGRTLRGLEGLELGRGGFGGGQGAPANPATQLNAAQARKVLAVLHNWQAKPVMTDAQAAVVNRRLMSFLNPAQKAALASQRGPGGRGGFGGRGGRPAMGGPPPGGMGGPGMGGPPPPQGGRPGQMGRGGFGGGGPGGFEMPAPRDYNPLNPATNPMSFARSRGAQRFSDLMARLSTVAK